MDKNDDKMSKVLIDLSIIPKKKHQITKGKIFLNPLNIFFLRKFAKCFRKKKAK